MALPHGFVEAFGDVSMESASTSPSSAGCSLTNRHLITFDYPSFELLKYPTRPYVNAPSDIEMRPHPLPRTALPEQDFSFFACLDLKPRPTTTTTTTTTRQPSSQVEAILYIINELVCDKPGTTEFRIARRSSPAIMTHISIRCSRQNIIMKWFELCPAEWQALMNLADEFQWIETLRDLVYRSADRAWYHVQNNWSDMLAQNEQSFLADMWNTSPPRSPVQLFERNLRSIVTDERIDFSNPFADFFDEDVCLPCGDTIRMSKSEYFGLSNDKCIKMVCSRCGDGVFQPMDDQELQLGRDWEALASFVEKNMSWVGLNEDVSFHARTMHVQAKTLFLAVHAAFESMEVPTLISPASLCFTHQPESKLAMSELESFLFANAATLIGTPGQLVAGLIDKAMSTSTGGSEKLADITAVPGWHASLRACFVRAINFLLRRDCICPDHRHHGLHRHANGLLHYNGSSWDSVQINDIAENDQDDVYEAEDEPGPTVEDIDKMMGNVRME